MDARATVVIKPVYRSIGLGWWKHMGFWPRVAGISVSMSAVETIATCNCTSEAVALGRSIGDFRCLTKPVFRALAGGWMHVGERLAEGVVLLNTRSHLATASLKGHPVFDGRVAQFITADSRVRATSAGAR